MKYEILSTKKKVLIPEGKVILIKAKELEGHYSDILNRMMPPDEELFVIPDDDDLLRDIYEEQRDESFWEPDTDGEFIADYIADIEGNTSNAYLFATLADNYQKNYLINDIIFDEPNNFLSRVFNAMILNLVAQNDDGEYTYFYVYNCSNKQFSIKQYINVQNNELIFTGKLNIKCFLDIIQEEYGVDLVERCIQQILRIQPWLEKKDIIKGNESIEWYKLKRALLSEIGYEDYKKYKDIRLNMAKAKLISLNLV